MSRNGRTRCLVFDCDGTLVDSETLGNEVFAAMLTDCGYQITAEQALNTFRGVRLAESLAQIEADMGRKLPDDFEIRFRQASADAYTQRLKPIAGARALVQSIDAPKCVASSGPRDKIELSLRLTGLAPFFPSERVFSAYEVNSWKPDPGLFIHAAARMGADPTDCIVIEDSLVGVRAGLAAGSHVIAFQPEGRHPELPDQVSSVSSMPELGRLLESIT